MKTGLYISGIAHVALILWLLFGGWLMRPDRDDQLRVSDVSILSAEEFAALTAATPVPVAPVTSPSPPARPTAPAPEPEASTPEPETAPEPEPEPAPEPEPEPEAPPPDAPRVAPVATPEPAPEAEIAETISKEVAPSPEAEIVVDEAPATAPEAATTEIVTEATETAALAPLTSSRPRARPARPVAAPVPDPVEIADPLADAVNEAVAEATSPNPASVRTGPPLTSGESNALRVAVGNCWNVGSLSSEALATTVVVGVSMARDGKPDIGSIQMISFTGGSDAAARKAYETARRAIIRCGATGYKLPSEKYAQWQQIEMTFNPENMRIK